MRGQRVRGGMAIAGIVLVVGLSEAAAEKEVFVVNEQTDSITVYLSSDNGDVSPLRMISGGMTELDSPHGVAVDPLHDELLVANTEGSSLTVYRRTAEGDEPPLRQISGGLTGLDKPEPVAMDLVHGEFVVGNTSGNSILVFSRTAEGGDAPLRKITSASLDSPEGVAVDTINDEIVVADGVNEAIFVFKRTDDGLVSPLREISGATTLLDDPHSVVVDTVNNEILVANAGRDSILVFSRTADNANGPVSPLREIHGSATELSEPEGVALDLARNEIFVANAGGEEGEESPFAITAYRRADDDDVPPLRQISGGMTGLGEPVSLALGPPGRALAPVVGEWGQLIMTVLVFAMGLWSFLRRRSESAFGPRSLG